MAFCVELSDSLGAPSMIEVMCIVVGVVASTNMTPHDSAESTRRDANSTLALLLLLAGLANTFSAAVVWIALTPDLADPVDWFCKLAAAAPLALNLAALLLASRFRSRS
jgi:TRAP-type C4-dicarboxylate transport system permease large subunit